MPRIVVTGTNTLKYQIHGNLSLQVLHSVEACVLVAIASGLCGVDVVMGGWCRISVVG